MRLILMRHAKSAHPAGVSDRDRPLNSRGRRDAAALGSELVAQGWVPDQVLLSDAQRTRETWQRLAPTLASTLSPLSLPELYLCGPLQTVEVLARHARGRCVLVLGHNPTTETLVERLGGRAERITTCNAALLSADAGTWSRVLDADWLLHGVLRPRPPRT